MRFFRRRKKGLIINNDITAIDGIVLARRGDEITEDLVARIAAIPASVRSDRVLLGETGFFVNIKYLIDHEKYQFITNYGRKKERLIRILSEVQFNPLVIKELEWMQRLEYHHHHSLVVALMVTRMMMDFYEDEALTREAAAGAITHNLGISRVPERILNKMGSLDPDEQAILQEHPIYCYLLLSYYYGDAGHPNAQVAFEHHEDLLGTGYPRKVVPENLVTRCINMCDLYDALICARPFRPAIPPQKAYEIVAEKVDQKQLDTLAFTLLNAYLQFID